MKNEEEINGDMDSAEDEIKKVLEKYGLMISCDGLMPTLRYEARLPSGNIYVHERQAF